MLAAIIRSFETTLKSRPVEAVTLHHLHDMTVGVVERGAVLGAHPGDRREPALDGPHRNRLAAGGSDAQAAT
jgi:hypothetical protein